MEEKKKHLWPVIKYAGAFIAFMIGSGFASGQEIMQFFTSYGLWGVGGALISMFLFSWSGAVFTGHGYDHKDDLDFKPSVIIAEKCLASSLSGLFRSSCSALSSS